MMEYLAKKKNPTKNKTTNIHHYWGEKKKTENISAKKNRRLCKQKRTLTNRLDEQHLCRRK